MPLRQRFTLHGPATSGLGSKHMHRLLMRGLPDGLGHPEAPRKAAGLLWHLDGDSLLVQADTPVELPKELATLAASEEVPTTDPETVDIVVRVCRRFTPTVLLDESTRELLRAAGKKPMAHARRQPVPDSRLEEWSTALLERRGVEVLGLTATRCPDISLDTRHPNHRVPTAQITATVTGGEPLNKLIVEGLGAAKNYGAGLVRVTTSQAN